MIEEQDAAAEDLALVNRFERPRLSDPLRVHDHFQIAGFVLFHAGVEQDPAAVDEDHIGKKILDLFHLMRRDDDGAAAIEVVVEQGIVELLAIEAVEAKGRLVEHQQFRVNGHDQREVKLGHHALG